MPTAGKADVNWQLLAGEVVEGVNESVNPQLEGERTCALDQGQIRATEPAGR